MAVKRTNAQLSARYAVMSAFYAGASVQCQQIGFSGWQDVPKPRWLDDFEYRIKPK
jgi:hypothetical protein